MNFLTILTFLILAPFLTVIYLYVPFYFRVNGRKKSVKRAIEKFQEKCKSKVILHGPPRMDNCLNNSPFVIKLETYLKMAKIPYEFDPVHSYGPKRKTPWISYKSVHMGDSNLIIKHLNKEFNIDFNKGKYSKTELAAAHGIRSIFDDHYFWCYAKWIWIDGIKYVGQDLTLKNPIFLYPFQMVIKLTLWLQGLGLHTESEFIQMMEDDLRSVSDFLGKKKYFLGEFPSELDACAFGFIAGTLLRLKKSPYQRLINEELTNLKDYFERMKAEFYPDWNQIILSPK